MQSVATGLVFLLLATQAARAVHAQETASAEQPSGEFFSGTITVLTDDKITVNRTALGKSSETRTFAITKSTKVEGKPRQNAGDSGFTKDEDVETALHIIVRAAQK